MDFDSAFIIDHAAVANQGDNVLCGVCPSVCPFPPCVSKSSAGKVTDERYQVHYPPASWWIKINVLLAVAQSRRSHGPFRIKQGAALAVSNLLVINLVKPIQMHYAVSGVVLQPEAHV